MQRILIVEDEKQMRMGLKDNLELEGYEVELAADGAEGLNRILESSFDLIILDVMMPKMSGFDVCKSARTNGVVTPIIMLTAKGEEIDKVLGLELGADDYLTKPFGLRELLARVKAILRREQRHFQGETQKVEIGRLLVDFDGYDAQVDGDRVAMTHKEFDVLHYLWEHRNQNVSRDELLNEVWGYEDYPTTRTVDNFMLSLRKKIESDPAQPKYILTVHGLGYKLVIG